MKGQYGDRVKRTPRQMNDLVQIGGPGFGIEIRPDCIDDLLPVQLVLRIDRQQLQ